MSFKDYMISTLHKLYRGDPWIQEIFNVTGLQLQDVEAKVEEVHANNFFDTATEEAIVRYEKEINVTPKIGETLDHRRSTIRARWIGEGKVDILQLQDIANSWKNGIIRLEFIGGRIHVRFISPIGVPAGLASLQEALEMVKPAHLALYYTFMYLTWGQAKDFGTWGQHKDNGTWLDVKRLKQS